MPAILSRLSILFINYISRDLDNTKILLYKFFVRYLIVNLYVETRHKSRQRESNSQA